MNTLEPEGGRKDRTTTIRVLSASGQPFVGVYVKHGVEKLLTDRQGQVRLTHINGSPVTIYGVVVHRVQEGVQNIFQRDSRTGNFKKR